MSSLSLAAPAQEPALGDAAAACNLVELKSYPLDVRYATAHNFMGHVLYPQARVFLAAPAARALERVERQLAKQHLGLVLFDGYRPWAITKAMWDQTPPEKRQYVADPASGSRHNRGCAVDLTLKDLVRGTYLRMPSDYDDFSEKAHSDYAGAAPEALKNRALLRAAMEAQGFKVYPYEWWHFDFEGWERFPILNYSFSQLDALAHNR